MTLEGKTVLITGAALRIGRSLALAVAHAGGDVALHYGRSQKDAETLQAEIEATGRKAFILQADLADSTQAAGLIDRALKNGPLFALVNNASIFDPHGWADTSLETWNHTLAVNLTAPFLLSQAFARSLVTETTGRIINLLDWRALHPRPDHLAYMISNAGLAALTQSLAAALAPRITVNGLALGAVLPPADGSPANFSLGKIPAHRQAALEEVGQALIFLLDGPAYVTGDVLHVDGGRHLT
jgi:NAD(P)-dependent dehydrogenase (short-subunit alcohol dehydrogenase family)